MGGMRPSNFGAFEVTGASLDDGSDVREVIAAPNEMRARKLAHARRIAVQAVRPVEATLTTMSAGEAHQLLRKAVSDGVYSALWRWFLFWLLAPIIALAAAAAVAMIVL